MNNDTNTNYIGTPFSVPESPKSEAIKPLKAIEKEDRKFQIELTHLEKLYKLNNIASLLKTLIFSVAVILSLGILYYAIQSEALSISKPIGTDANIVQEITDNSLRLLRLREIVSANASYIIAAAATKSEIETGLSEKQKDQTINDSLLNATFGTTEKFGFSRKGGRSDNSKTRVINFTVNAGKDSPANNGNVFYSLTYYLQMSSPQIDETSVSNFLDVQNKVIWSATSQGVSTKELTKLGVDWEKLPPNGSTQVNEAKVRQLIALNDVKSTKEIVKEVMPVLDASILNSQAIQSRMLELERQQLGQINSRLIATLSGNTVYLFDIFKRATILILISAITLTFLKRLTSELKFMNQNISRHFTYIYMENSKHTVDDQITLYKHLYQKQEETIDARDSSIPTIPAELLSAMKEIIGKKT